MNLLGEFQRGLEGRNVGRTTGIKPLDAAIDGIQRASLYGVAAGPKVGKSTLVDYAFLLAPFLESTENIEWIYFSYEISRIKKEFKFASFFMNHDYGLGQFEHAGVLYDMSPRYLQGRLKDVDGRPIQVANEHQQLFREIYEKRIVPIFGRYDANGNKVAKGKVMFIEHKDNPTGMKNLLMRYADDNGAFVHEEYQTKGDNGQPVTGRRISGYVPTNPDLFTIVITDHLRKPRRERGFTLKENMDKLIEYQVELRNWCGFTFVDIVHLNRSIANIERIKYQPEFIYPTGDDVKDSGNLSEEADYMITMFNANDDKYGIKKHFGVQLEGPKGGLLHPSYRSIHLVESRDTECPVHIQANMYGGINMFSGLRLNQ